MIHRLIHRYDRHYHERHKHGRKHLIADIVGVAIIAGLLAFIFFIFFGYNRGLFGRLVDLQVRVVPDFVISGENLTLRFHYQNQGEQTLGRAVLKLDLPDTFTVQPAANFKDNSFFIGDLAPGSAGELELTGRLIAEVGSFFSPVATLSFEPTRFAFLTTDKVVVRSSFEVIDSSLALSIEAPEEVSDQGEFEMILKYANTSVENILPAVMLEPVSSKNFALSISSIDLEGNVWRLGDLAPGQKGEIGLVGKFDSKGALNEVLKFRAFVEQNSQQLFQAERSKSFKIFYPQFALEIVPDRPAAEFGERVSFKIRYQNNEKFALADLGLVAVLDPTIFDLSSIQAGPAKLSNRFIHWVAASNPEFARVEPGAAGELSFSVRLVARPPLAGQPLVILDARYFEEGTERVYKVTREARLAVNSDLRLGVVGRYFSEDGEQLGRGPLPPRVGRETKYWVFVTVSNSLNTVEDVLARLRLGPGVSWTGRATASGGGGWDFSGGEVVWRIGLMEAGLRQFTGGIEVSLVPSSDQAGLEPLLVSSAVVEGVDAVTGNRLERVGPTVSTNLADLQSVGKSKVRP